MIEYIDDLGSNEGLLVGDFDEGMRFGIANNEVTLGQHEVHALIAQLVSWLRRQELVEDC